MANEPFDLREQVVLVSGAGRGIGLSCARLIAQCGASVAMTARTEAQVASAAAAINEVGGRAHAFQANVAEIDAHEALLDAVERACGPLTGLINVAGVSPSLQRAERITPEEFDAIFEINQRGTFFLTQAVAKRWIAAQRPGAIVSISSIGAETGLPRQAPYSMSRGAVEALTKTLAAEWARAPAYPIRVNCVAPGYIETDLTAGLPDWYREHVNAHTALGRMGGDDEVAGAVAFLLSDAASYITGTSINVSGGYGMWSLPPAASP